MVVYASRAARKRSNDLYGVVRGYGCGIRSCRCICGNLVGTGDWVFRILDGVATVIIGLILGATAVWLAYETKGLLIGESANREVVQGIRQIVGGFSEITHVNEVLTMHMGPEFILVNISVDFQDGLPSEHVESTIAKIDHTIKKAHPRVKRVFVEAEKRRRKIWEGLGP